LPTICDKAHRVPPTLTRSEMLPSGDRKSQAQARMTRLTDAQTLTNQPNEVLKWLSL